MRVGKRRAAFSLFGLPALAGQAGQYLHRLSGLSVQVRALTGQPDTQDTPPARVCVGS